MTIEKLDPDLLQTDAGRAACAKLFLSFVPVQVISRAFKPHGPIVLWVVDAIDDFVRKYAPGAMGFPSRYGIGIAMERYLKVRGS